MSAARKGDAEAVLGQLEEIIHRFHGAPDTANVRIHCLFAGLYRETTTQWLAALEQTPAPDFAYLVMRRFYDLYDLGVLQRLDVPLEEVPRQWRKYHWLARRLTMRSPISLHLLLISLGVRAHIRHDLGIAIRQAACGHESETGRDATREELIGTLSQQAFFRAALDFVDWHRTRQRGWRRAVLGLYALGLRMLKPVWVTVMEAWRGAAYRDAFRPVATAPQGKMAGPESG